MVLKGNKILLKGKIESQAIVKEMLNECSGPLNFHSFLSLFAEKIGSSDPESVVINAYSMFDPADTGSYYMPFMSNILRYYFARQLMM